MLERGASLNLPVSKEKTADKLSLFTDWKRHGWFWWRVEQYDRAGREYDCYVWLYCQWNRVSKSGMLQARFFQEMGKLSARVKWCSKAVEEVNMKIIVGRVSVSAGDDTVPHKTEYEVSEEMTVGAFFCFLEEDSYLPLVQEMMLHETSQYQWGTNLQNKSVSIRCLVKDNNWRGKWW